MTWRIIIALTLAYSTGLFLGSTELHFGVEGGIALIAYLIAFAIALPPAPRPIDKARARRRADVAGELRDWSNRLIADSFSPYTFPPGELSIALDEAASLLEREDPWLHR